MINQKIPNDERQHQNQNVVKFKKSNAKMGIFSLSFLPLAACTGSGSGQGASPTETSAPQNVSGTVVDGYIAGATVFIDENNNLTLDNGEVSTITDSQGNWTLEARDGEVVSIGGIDITTGSSLDDVVLTAPSGSTVVTPVTTLLTQFNGSEAELKASLGIDSSIDLTSFDPIAALEADSSDAEADAYLQINQIALAAATTVASLAQGAGVETNFSDAMDAALAAIAEEAESGPLDLTDPTSITNIINAIDVDNDIDATTTTAAANAIAEVTEVIDEASGGLDPDALAASLIAINELSDDLEDLGSGDITPEEIDDEYSETNVQTQVDENKDSLPDSDNTDTDVIPGFDSAEGTEDTAIVINVMENDISLSDDTLTLTGATLDEDSEQYAVISINSSAGTVTITPENNFSGNISYSYTFRNSNGDVFNGKGSVDFAEINDEPFGTPIINGTPDEFETLTADTTGISDNDGLGTFSYQWYANNVAVIGAVTPSLTLSQDHVGKTITFKITYTDGNGHVEEITSAATTAVQNVDIVPTGGINFSAENEIGDTVTVTNTFSDVDGGVASVMYQWKRDQVNINGATGDQYTLTDDDIGTNIGVVATVTDNQGGVYQEYDELDSQIGGFVLNSSDTYSDYYSQVGGGSPTLELSASEREIDVAGGNGPSTINTGLGHDRVEAAGGSDIINTGDGNDTIVMDFAQNDFTEDTVNGGNDNDRIIVENANSFNASDLNVSNIETIDLSQDTNAQTFTISKEDVIAMSDASNTIIIDGGPEDTVVSSDDWIYLFQSGVQSIGADLYAVYYIDGTSAKIYMNLEIGNLVGFPDAGIDGFTDDGNDTYSSPNGFLNLHYFTQSFSTADLTINADAFINYIRTGSGNDTINVTGASANVHAGYGNDFIAGYIHMSYLDSHEGVTLNFNTDSYSGGTAAGDSFDFSSAPSDAPYAISGSDYDDHITGTDSGMAYLGEGGNDTMIAGSGDDSFRITSGTNTIIDSGGHDTLDYYYSDAGGLDINLANGTTVAIDNDSPYAINDTYSEIEDVRGTTFDDIITGNDSDNIIDAFGGDDLINGGGGSDYINADAGDDIIHGGTDTVVDVLNAESGDDTLYVTSIDDLNVDVYSGGTGEDTLFFDNDLNINFDLGNLTLESADSLVDANFDILDIGGNAANSITLSENDINNLDSFGELYFIGDTDDTLIVTDGNWTQGSDVVDGDVTYEVYSSTNNYTLYVDEDISLTI